MTNDQFNGGYMIIDTHCHLDDNRYFSDLDEVLKRAQSEGVKGFLIPGADPDDLNEAYIFYPLY